MTVRGRITYVGAPDATLRELNRAAKEGLQESGRFWHQWMMPDHFERSARRRYGYRERTIRYMKQKAKRFGSNTDLVKSGTLKRQLRRRVQITGTSKKMTVSLRGPAYFHMFPKGSRVNPDKHPTNDKGERPPRAVSVMAAEVTATTQDEINQLAKIVDQHATKRLNNTRTRRVVNV